MNSPMKIAVVTGTRAEYGLLKPLILKLKENYPTTIVATGMHLSPEFGMTINEIEQGGLHVDEKVEILLSADTKTAVTKSMGLGLISFADVLSRIMPDLLVVLGDRFEILSVVTAATVLKIPVAHLHGGEVTEGAIDDNIRHAISKMSHLHFTSTEEHRKRVIQLGEQPNRVFDVGAIGLDNINSLSLLSRDDLSADLGIQFRDRIFLVTYHPVTLESLSIDFQVDNLLSALSDKDATVVFTKANADAQGRYINSRIESWVSDHADAFVFSSLGSLRYLSLLKEAEIVIGNSSSGIIEAPSLNTPTVNIGERQRGRVRARSVIDCSYNKDEIHQAIQKAGSSNFLEKERLFENPYGDGSTAQKIIEILAKIDLKSLIPKHFYDWS